MVVLSRIQSNVELTVEILFSLDDTIQNTSKTFVGKEGKIEQELEKMF